MKSQLPSAPGARHEACSPERVLRQRFKDSHVTVHGCVALFRARD